MIPGSSDSLFFMQMKITTTLTPLVNGFPPLQRWLKRIGVKEMFFHMNQPE